MQLALLDGAFGGLGQPGLRGHMRRRRGADGGVLDALMEHAVEHRGKGVADARDVAQGQRRVVQLAVVELAAHELGDELADLLGGGVVHAAHGGLHGIGQHDDGAFLALGPAAVVAEIRDIDGLTVGLLQGLVVEEHDRRVAVVLHDDVLNLLGQAVLLGHDEAVAGMRGDDGGAHVGVGVLMRVVADLVFLEIQGPLELADVVEIRARAGQQGIAAHGLGGGLGEVGHDDAVVVGARRLDQQAAQQGVVGIAQLQELSRGGQVEEGLRQRVQRDAQHRGQQRAAGAPQGVCEHVGHGGIGHETDGQDDDDVGDGRHDAAQQHLLAVGPAADDAHGQQAADEGGEQEVDHGGAKGGIAPGDKGADQHAHAQRARDARIGREQAREHHGAEQSGGEVGVDQLPKDAQPQRDALDEHQNDEPARVLQRLPVKEVEGQQQHGGAKRHQQGRAHVHHDVDVVVVQHAQAAQHFQLVGGHALAGEDDVLPLLVDDRLHGGAGLVAQLFGGLLVDDHVGADDLAQDGGHDVLEQVDVGLVADDLLQILYGLVHIPFADGGVEGVFNGGGDVFVQVGHLLVGGAQQGVELIIRQGELRQKRAGIVQLGLGKDIFGLLLRIIRRVLLQHAAAVLLHGVDLREHGGQVLHHLPGHILLEDVAGLDLIGGRFALAGGADLIHHVLAGGDGGVGDIAHLQIIPLGRDGGHEQDAQDHGPGQHHVGALGRARAQRMAHSLPAEGLFFANGMLTGHHCLHPFACFRRFRKPAPRFAPGRGAPRRSGPASR